MLTWRQVFKTTQSQKTNYSQSLPIPISAKNIRFTELPLAIAELIEWVGLHTGADLDDIVDMKAHVLNFINTQTNGFAVALNGFGQIKAEIELDHYFKNIREK